MAGSLKIEQYSQPRITGPGDERIRTRLHNFRAEIPLTVDNGVVTLGTEVKVNDSEHLPTGRDAPAGSPEPRAEQPATPPKP